MKDFGCCVWYIPEENTWHTLANGFTPHMTIEHSLSYRDALALYTSITPCRTRVVLDKLYTSLDDDFRALYYSLKPIIYPPKWWPINPHISFVYQYVPADHWDHSALIESLGSDEKPCEAGRSGTLNTIALAQCKGHFSKWKILETKELNE